MVNERERSHCHLTEAVARGPIVVALQEAGAGQQPIAVHHHVDRLVSDAVACGGGDGGFGRAELIEGGRVELEVGETRLVDRDTLLRVTVRI